MRARCSPLALGLSLALAAGRASATELPPEGRCPGAAAGPAALAEDALRAPLRTGQELALADLPRLRDLLPSEIWRHRDVFFFEGMRLTLGPCHRRYAASAA